MLGFLTDPNLVATFALLVGLELVLGIDNILLISIVTSRLPESKRALARILGLSIALALRLLMLFGVTALQQMTDPVLFGGSWRDLILLGGGLFLLYKAAKEMHHVVERSHEEAALGMEVMGLGAAIGQIVALDAVFSIDSVITAVGLTDVLAVICAAVVVSFIGVLIFARSISEFVLRHPTLKILALAFLLVIGVTLCMESFHYEIPKAYLYLPMGFALMVELVQLRHDYNRRRVASRSGAVAAQ